ncbi:MAG: hypothetical protein ACQEWF_23005 [Bacillota bacterium]
MADRNDVFRTGGPVVEPGNYVCEAGERTAYREGEAFKACPASGEKKPLVNGMMMDVAVKPLNHL